MTLTEFMSERYKNREDKDNIFGVGVSDAEFRQFIIDYLLGEDWYVADPIGPTQVNEVALCEILEKYSKRYRKECYIQKRRKSDGANDRWIPVSERLPKDHENVLMYLSSNQITIGLYNSHRLPFMDKPIGWGADAPHGWSSDEVIAWMPLPKPYKS